MRSTTCVPIALLLGSVLLQPAATAATWTCRGVPATMLPDSSTSVMVGTEGNDVIVTHGADVHALGGDDLVCSVGPWPVLIDAGAGNDVIDVGSGRAGRAVLGPGADQYIGSGFYPNTVIAGTDTSPSVDNETDVIDNLPGDAPDTVVSGQRDTPNSDQVRMTSAGTLIWRGTPTVDSALDGGHDSALDLELDMSGPAVLNNVVGKLKLQPFPTLYFKGFTRFTVVAHPGSGPFDFRGSDLDEALDLTTWPGLVHRLDLGGGNDLLRVVADSALPRGTSYDAGPGARDRINLTMPHQADVDLDMGRGRLSTGAGREEVTVPARLFEDAHVAARDVEIVGTSGPNALDSVACRTTVHGRGAADQITYDATGTASEELTCQERSARFAGGPGADTLNGSPGKDTLIGGPGRDSADGDRGRDVCQAEKTEDCEVRR